MTRDILEIDNYTVLFEETPASNKEIIEYCNFEHPVIGIAFYGSGDVKLNVNHNSQTSTYHQTKGLAMSFFANDQVEFMHTIKAELPMRCIVVVLPLQKLMQPETGDEEAFKTYLKELVYPDANYVKGPSFFMAPEMEAAVEKMFNTTYQGRMRMMFLKSQVLELLSHFFAQMAEPIEQTAFKKEELQKLYQAKDILTNNIHTPPSLKELSKLIGLNTYALKKNFKALFGMPVFKYLQQERLNKAHELLRRGEFTVQEAAWEVGYESISSFSNAFSQKFGARPSAIRSQLA